MLVEEILYECEVVYVDEDGKEILDEGFIRQFKKVGGKVKKQFRCTSGQKKGRIVAEPQSCAKRKDPKKKRLGKKVARMKKGIIKTKSKRTKRQQQSKRITRLNKRLSGTRT